MKGRRNRPAGEAKTRPGKRAARKPYVEQEDGRNFNRLNTATKQLFSLAPAEAEKVRTTANALNRRKS
jgi:hypothetical protein